MIEFDLLMFDLDGTLADTKRDLATAVNLTLLDFGLPQKPPEVIYTYVGDGVRKLLERSFEGFDAGIFDQALASFRHHYMEHLVETTAYYPGVLEVLEFFRTKKKAVVTNKPSEYTDKLLSGLGAKRHFDLVVGGNSHMPLKPHPAMIQAAVEHLKVRPERALMIGDSVNDIRASRSAGVKVCAVGYGLGPPEDLRRAEPDLFCEQIIELKEMVR